MYKGSPNGIKLKLLELLFAKSITCCQLIANLKSEIHTSAIKYDIKRIFPLPSFKFFHPFIHGLVLHYHISKLYSI